MAFGVGLAVAAPQDAAPQEAPPPSDQAGPPPEGRAGRGGMNPDTQLQMMSKRLNLSDDQASQIRPILADAFSQMQALRTDASMAPRDKMAKMRSIRQDSDARIKAVLTDAQRTQYEQLEQRRMQQRMQQRNGNAGGDQTNQ